MRRYRAAAVVALTVTAVAAVPASAAKPRTTITDTVVALSGSSGFDSNGADFDILREAVLATGLDSTLGLSLDRPANRR